MAFIIRETRTIDEGLYSVTFNLYHVTPVIQDLKLGELRTLPTGFLNETGFKTREAAEKEIRHLQKLRRDTECSFKIIRVLEVENE